MPSPARRAAAALLAALLVVAPFGPAAPALALTTHAASKHPRARIASGSVALRIIQLARAELAKGVHEIPDGSNRAPAIRRYETATAGAMYGAPWCAYFVSYIAKEAGVPIGPGGEGMGYVPYIRAWARQTGRWTMTPRPGELITFPEHVGIVENVYAHGQMTTIEGNADNAVRREWRSTSEAVGFVRLAAAPNGSVPPPSKPTSPAAQGPPAQKLVARIHAYPSTTIAVGQTVDFTSEDSSGNVVRSDWDLDGNGHYDARGDSVSKTYTTPGQFHVKLRVTDSRGKTATASTTITVRNDQPPVAQLAVSDTSLTVGQTLHADASASTDPDGHVVKYEWDLDGNGNWSEGGSHSSYTYTVPGDYNAGVRVTDDAGNASETYVHIHVSDYPPPVAHIECDSDTVSAGQWMTCLSDDSQSPYGIRSHDWDMNGDGTYDVHGTRVNYSWSTPGDYTIHLHVTDQHGKVADATQVVHVIAAVTAKISAPSSATLGQAITLDGTGSTDSAGRIVRWDWDTDGDGYYDSSGSKLTVQYAAPGTYTIHLRVTDNHGQQSVATTTLKVTDQAPTARIVLPSSPQRNVPLSFDGTTSSDPDSAIVKYEWDLDGNGSYETTGSRPTFTYTASGTYTIGLRVTDAWGTTATTSATLTIP